MHWYTDVLKQYAVFNGRASRPEYWWFTLISLIISVMILVVVGAGSSFATAQAVGDLYALAVLLPSIGVGIRRLHDTNHSGWWILISFIPIVGTIWIVVLLATRSDAGPNRFGPNPQDAGLTPRFDSQTGQPLQPSAPRFDPHTGQPLYPPIDPPS